MELRAVNHRYLDVNVKAPRGYGFLEDALKKATGARISRGKVDIFVAITDMGAQETAIVLNKELARGYLDALQELRDAFHLHDDITVMSIARMPDVLVSERLEVDADALTAAVLEVFAHAVDEFDVMRGREGERWRPMSVAGCRPFSGWWKTSRNARLSVWRLIGNASKSA